MQSDASGKMKVFVSYARADLDFADQLVLALEDKNFESLLDRHDIDVGEKWQERLSALLYSCDTVAFVLSKSSASSKICQWEVEEAVNMGKRIIPVLPESLNKIALPPLLAERNFVHFYRDAAIPGSGFYDGVQKLERALRVDLSWLRLQTKLGEFSAEWQRSKSSDKLLRGESLIEALAWLGKAPAGTSVSEQVRNFIAASDSAEILRKAEATAQIVEREATLQKLSRRTTIGLAGAGALSVAAGGLAWWGNDAEQRFRESQIQVQKAREESKLKAIETEAARMDIVGQITAYATSPGGVSFDGEEGTNSPYTKAVTTLLSDPNISLLQALMQGNSEVYKQFSEQRPYFSTNVNGEVYVLRQPKKRVLKAICIAVSELKGTTLKLKNAENDARRWKTLLEKGGFDVSMLIDPSSHDVEAILDQFGSSPDKHGMLNKQESDLFVPASITISPKAESGSLNETGTALPKIEEPDDKVQTEETDLAKRGMTLKPDNFVFIFYSGIGVTELGENYLVFSNTELKNTASTVEIYRPGSVSTLSATVSRYFGLSALVLDTTFTSGVSVYQNQK
jgi:TIR domain/Caspase domain